MGNDYTGELTRIFSDVLEQFAFMFADPPESESPALGEDLIVASMTFRGPFQGALTLAAPRSMGPVLAANVLGLDPDDELVSRAPFDALKELLNVTCGNVLTAIAGEEPVFDLTVPEIEERPAGDWGSLHAADNTIYYLVDDFPVLLHLETTQEVRT